MIQSSIRSVRWITALAVLGLACQPADEPPLSAEASAPVETSSPPSWQAAYTTSDTTAYLSGGMGSRFMLLFREGDFVDTVDAYTGVHFIGRDSLVAWPVAQFSDEGDYLEGNPQALTLITPENRIALRSKVPHFDDFYASPVFDGPMMRYWCLAPSETSGASRLLACQANLRTGEVDSVYLETYSMETDNWGHLLAPQQTGEQVVFERPGKRWLLDTEAWRLTGK